MGIVPVVLVQCVKCPRAHVRHTPAAEEVLVIILQRMESKSDMLELKVPARPSEPTVYTYYRVGTRHTMMCVVLWWFARDKQCVGSVVGQSRNLRSQLLILHDFPRVTPALSAFEHVCTQNRTPM